MPIKVAVGSYNYLYGEGLKKLLDGEKEAKVVATCCGSAPSGHARWTLRLLAERIVELDIVESISHETVRRCLKKTS